MMMDVQTLSYAMLLTVLQIKAAGYTFR